MKDDLIIAQAFVKIREGIVSNQWQLICDAYEQISGEKLPPPDEKSKNRIDHIRELMQSIATEDKQVAVAEEVEPVEVPKTASDKLNITQLKAQLINLGIDQSQLDGKKKPELLKLLKNLSGTVDDVDVNPVVKTQGGLKIITEEVDPLEVAFNQRLAKKKVKSDYKRSEPPVDNSDDPDASVRFYSKPPRGSN